MDRVEFFRSVPDGSEDCLKEIILKYFDETMLLYNLVGQYDNINITKNDSDKCVASFSVLFNSRTEALRMHNIMNHRTLTCYDQKYNISTNLTENTVDINMINANIYI